jgi:hypothetical protein
MNIFVIIIILLHLAFMVFIVYATRARFEYYKQQPKENRRGFIYGSRCQNIILLFMSFEILLIFLYTVSKI